MFTITSICHRMTNYPLKWAWSESRDLNLKYNVKVGNKEGTINVKKTCQFEMV